MRSYVTEQAERETGKVSEGQLTTIAEMALNDGAIIFNPKEADHGDLMAVLKAAW